MTERSIRPHIRELRRHGHLVMDQRKRKPALYTIMVGEDEIEYAKRDFERRTRSGLEDDES